MKRKRFSIERITAILSRASTAGRSNTAVWCPQRHASSSREESLKLKRLVADLSLDKVMLQDVLQKRVLKPVNRRAILTRFGVKPASKLLKEDDPRDVRDRALLWLAYETMARRSEVVTLTVDDLADEPDGSGRLLIARAKADQEGQGEVLYVSAETMASVRRWLKLARHKEGALFRSIPRVRKTEDGGARSQGRYSRPLTDGDIARIFKKRARDADIDPTLISGHSMRVGATQDLLAGNFSAAAVMKQGRWKSERMVMRYGENIEAGRGAMAQWLKQRRDAAD